MEVKEKLFSSPYLQKFKMWLITSKQGTCWLNAFQDISSFVCEKNKENKKNLRSISGHKIVMLHRIYT